ncbi:MAG TPA: phytanoyl-CoA dioxygenase family protein [Steroidobacteraceae bacterium]|nr:phytanoyl-CoA dioxygenase family protein [Steroidobacteraceae bacterium]
MFEIPAPTGDLVSIPDAPDEDRAYFRSVDAGARRYLEEEGYLVLRRLLSAEACADIRRAFAEEVKPFPGFLYRQTTARAERNQVNAHGHVMNPLLNLQDLDRQHFARLRRRTLDAFTAPAVVAALRAVFGEDPKLVQSMYFEGNSATWAHQDTYYLDSERIGTMVAAWFALEDIHPGAGRFYVYARSHRLDIAKNGGDFDVAFHHDRYKKLIVDLIRAQGLELRAPALAAGDVLLWNARTIHGSLPTHGTANTRQSLTAHYIPKSHRFLQLQSRIKPLALAEHNGIQVHCPKDQQRLQNRMTLFIESHLPGPFYLAKRLAVKAATR